MPRKETKYAYVRHYARGGDGKYFRMSPVLRFRTFAEAAKFAKAQAMSRPGGHLFNVRQGERWADIRS